VGGAAPDAVHVLLVGADVLRRQVPAAEGVDGVGEGVDQCRRLRRRIPEDHRLAATEVEARERRLGRHGPGQPQDVLHGVAERRVGVEAHAAEGRSEDRGMHGDDRPQPGLGPPHDGDALVLGVGQLPVPRSTRAHSSAVQSRVSSVALTVDRKADA
jgi:hypothetical protein